MLAIVSAPAGFFQGEPVTPSTAADLISATTGALAASAAAEAAATSAEAQAATAATAASAAASSLASIGSSVTAAAASATAAAGSATTATTQATNAASSATAASGSATTAGSYATSSGSSAVSAAASVTNAASAAASCTSSASAASTSAGNASTSASAAASSASAAASSASAAAGSASQISGMPFAGKNLLDNGSFGITQRGLGAWTSTMYGPDRWYVALTGSDTFTAQVQSPSPLGSLGVPQGTNVLTMTNVGHSGSGNTSYFGQRMEDVTKMAGQAITVSFWASTSTPLAALGVGLYQNFGSGGSPSAQVSAAGGKINLTGGATWTRYSIPLTLPTVTGKTFGTNGVSTSYTELDFYLSAGDATTSAFVGSLGAQTGTIQVTGMQVEFGSVMTSLETYHPALMLLRCQRYYAVEAFSFYGYAAATTSVGGQVQLPTAMRASPSVTPSYSNANVGTPSMTIGASSVVITAAVSPTGGFILAGSFTAAADL